MNTNYLDLINDISAEDEVERVNKIVDVIMSTNDAIKATPNFAKEVRCALIIMVFSNGFTAHLYHDVMNVKKIHQKITDFDRYDVVNEADKEQTVKYFNSAHVMAMEGMLCRVFGVEYLGETGNNHG